MAAAARHAGRRRNLCRLKAASMGLRPGDGLRRPPEQRRRRPTPGTACPGKADFNQRTTVNTTPSVRPMTSGKYIS